jgi:hypothetical protein
MSRIMTIGVSLCFLAAAQGQASKDDISGIVAAGKINGDIYSNTYFGISLTAPKAQFSAPVSVNIGRRNARLVNISYDSPEGAKNYTLGLMAESLKNYDKNMSPTAYVRMWRQELERLDGLTTFRGEFPLTISGIPFMGAVLKVHDKVNGEYYRGIYSSFIAGYVLSIDVQSGSEDRLQSLLSSAVKINPKKP